jgi:hypothetical protein
MLFPHDEDTINQQQGPQEAESTKCEILDNNDQVIDMKKIKVPKWTKK